MRGACAFIGVNCCRVWYSLCGRLMSRFKRGLSFIFPNYHFCPSTNYLHFPFRQAFLSSLCSADSLFLWNTLVRRSPSCLSELPEEQTRVSRLRPNLQISAWSGCDTTGAQRSSIHAIYTNLCTSLPSTSARLCSSNLAVLPAPKSPDNDELTQHHERTAIRLRRRSRSSIGQLIAIQSPS